MTALRILFVNAIDSTKEIQTHFPPLGIGYLVSSLRERFGKEMFKFRVIDDDIEQGIRSFRPDIVGISSVSQNYDKAISYAKIAKGYGPWVLCGGVHISMLPASMSKDMDVGVIGEGEQTICELVALFLSKGAFEPADLKHIKGIIYHDDGQIVATDEREPIADLDTIPRPARDIFPVQRETYLFTSRGCPFCCTFCASSRFWKGPVRKFSAQSIISEITYLVNEQGVTDICLFDDIFPLDKERVRDCLSGLNDAELTGNIRFTCSIRANLVNRQIVALLKALGVVVIGVGMESGCQRTLDYLKGTQRQDNINAIETIRKGGLKVHASFIIGSPDETNAEAAETLEFIRKHHLSADLYLLTPFPGTPIWDYALDKGLVSNDMAWSRLDVSSQNDPVIVSEHMTKDDVDGFFDTFVPMQRRRKIFDLAREGLKHPERVPGYILDKTMSWGR